MLDPYATSGRQDTEHICFHAEDRLPQLGPIADFTHGPQFKTGSHPASGDPYKRGAPPVVACTGHGRSGALALLRSGIVPDEVAAQDFTAAGQCTGALCTFAPASCLRLHELCSSVRLCSALHGLGCISPYIY